MISIRSLEDLHQARQLALEKQQELVQKYRIRIHIGMSSCSIAAGSRDTFTSINRMIEEENLPGVNTTNVRLTQTGCIGLCALEPIVQVQIADQTPVTYGKVTPEVAHLILQNHIGKGLVVQEYVVENI